MDPRSPTESKAAAATRSLRTPPRPLLRDILGRAAERRMESGSGVPAQLDGSEPLEARRSPRSRSAEAEASAAAERQQRRQRSESAALRRMVAGVVPAGVGAAGPSARLAPPRGALEVDGGAAPRPPTLLVQRLAAALRGPFALGVDAVLYGFLGAVWLALLAGNIPRWAGGGSGSAVAAIGRNVSWVAVRALVLLAPAFFPLFAFRWQDRDRVQAVVQGQPENPGVVGGGQATDGVHRPERNEIVRKLARCVNSITIWICIVFGLIIIIGILMKQHSPGRGSWLRIIGSLLVDTSFLLCSALSSLIFVPNLVLELKRAGVM